MEEALMLALRADAALAALVGGRIDWGARPQADAVPAVTLHLVDSPKSHTMRGRETLTQSRVQIDCFGGDYFEAKFVARAVSAAIDALKAEPLRCFLLDERDDDFTLADGPDASGASEIHRTIIDVRVWFS